jgi:hypothetical protein
MVFMALANCHIQLIVAQMLQKNPNFPVTSYFISSISSISLVESMVWQPSKSVGVSSKDIDCGLQQYIVFMALAKFLMLVISR